MGRHMRAVIGGTMCVAVALTGWLAWVLTAGVESAPANAAVSSAAVAGVTATDMSAWPAHTHVVGLGDSVMSGTNCGCAGPVAEYAARLSRLTHTSVRGTNLGIPGATTQTLLTALQSDAATRDAVRRSSIVLVIIGANDLYPEWQHWRDTSCDSSCYQPAVDAMGGRLDQILQLINQLRGGAPTRLLVMNYWNVFTDGAVAKGQGGQAQLSWSNQVTRAANRTIARETHRNGGTLVDLWAPFKGDHDPTRDLASDGDHPDASGVHVLVGSLLAATI